MSSDRNDVPGSVASKNVEDDFVRFVLRLDHIKDEIGERFLKKIERCTGDKTRDQCTSYSEINQSSNIMSIDETTEIDNINVRDRQAWEIKHQMNDKESEKNELSTELKNLKNAGIEVNSEQLLDSFDAVFDPIHTVDMLLSEISTPSYSLTCTSLESIRQSSNVEKDIPPKKQVKMRKSHKPTYIDYANISDEEAMATMKKKGKRKSTIKSFPQKMYLIVERSEVDGYSDIVSWLPHGRAFKIHNTTLFLKTILPKFFYQTQMSSFIRQLGAYGFRRFSFDKGSYFHDLFLRGRSELCKVIGRQEKRAIVDPANEPNLNHYDPMPPSDLSVKVKSSPGNASLASTNCNCADKDRAPIIYYAIKNSNTPFPTVNIDITHLNLSLKDSEQRNTLNVIEKSLKGSRL